MGGLGAVGMRIYKSRKDDLAGYIYDFRFFGDFDLGSFADFGDAIALDDDSSIFNSSVFSHGDDLSADQSDGRVGSGVFGLETDSLFSDRFFCGDFFAFIKECVGAC